MRNRKASMLLIGLLAFVVLLGACTVTTKPVVPAQAPKLASGQTPAQQDQSKGALTGKSEFAKQNTETKTALPSNFVGKMSIEPKQGRGGTQVTVTATGMPANAKMDLVWATAEGEWMLDGEEQEEYHGRTYKPKNITLSTVTTDASGNINTSFAVPQGYGYHHDVLLLQDGAVRNKADFLYEWKATITPTSGPAGTPITLDFEGMGSDYYSSTWQVLYDNSDMGFLSSVSTNGRATTTITATGRPGKHFIKLYIGSFQYAYLNVLESPKKDMPPITLEFEVTDGPAVMPQPFEKQSFPAIAGAEPAGSGPAIWTTVASATVGTPNELKGKGLPPNTELDIRWEQQVGSRVTARLWDKVIKVLGKVKTDAQGAFSFPFKQPDDLGGLHTIAVAQGDKELAIAKTTITASAVSIDNATGPAGTVATIHLKGVGWTETANIYTVLYDNKDAGYVCGFSTQGTVTLPMTLVGEPGVHYIDLFPGIYKGKEETVLSTFRQPMLNVADHPGEKVPALHFAVTVTP